MGVTAGGAAAGGAGGWEAGGAVWKECLARERIGAEGDGKQQWSGSGGLLGLGLRVSELGVSKV